MLPRLGDAMSLVLRTARLLLCACVLAMTITIFAPAAAAQSWTQLAPTGAPPPDSTSTMVGSPLNNRLTFWGGCGFTGCLHSNAVWLLTNADGASGTPQWSQLTVTGPTPPGRHAHRMVYDTANNRMIIFGGCLGGCTPVTGDAFVLSNADGSQAGSSTWTQLATLPAPGRGHPVMVYDQSTNRVIIFGGQNGAGTVAGNTYPETWV